MYISCYMYFKPAERVYFKLILQSIKQAALKFIF